jgi:putative transcriptional regulator
MGCSVRNKIRELRFRAGEMTQQQLADRVGLTRQTINAIEGGKYSPTLEAAFAIADVLGAPLEQVFEYAPNGQPRSSAAKA